MFPTIPLVTQDWNIALDALPLTPAQPLIQSSISVLASPLLSLSQSESQQPPRVVVASASSVASLAGVTIQPCPQPTNPCSAHHSLLHYHHRHPPMALNFEALHGAALASCLATSTCTPERCFMSPGHTTPFHGVSSAPFSAGWPRVSLAPISGHGAACVASALSSCFPLLSLVPSPGQQDRHSGSTRDESAWAVCAPRACI